MLYDMTPRGTTQNVSWFSIDMEDDEYNLNS